jgi:hypothetical protein
VGTWEACTSVDFVNEHFTTLDFFEGGQGQDLAWRERNHHTTKGQNKRTGTRQHLGELSIGTDDGVEVPAHQRRHSHVVLPPPPQRTTHMFLLSERKTKAKQRLIATYTRGEEGEYVVPQLLWQGVRAFHLSVA